MAVIGIDIDSIANDRWRRLDASHGFVLPVDLAIEGIHGVEVCIFGSPVEAAFPDDGCGIDVFAGCVKGPEFLSGGGIEAIQSVGTRAKIDAIVPVGHRRFDGESCTELPDEFASVSIEAVQDATDRTDPYAVADDSGLSGPAGSAPDELAASIAFESRIADPTSSKAPLDI
jgi:hypothetical protein